MKEATAKSPHKEDGIKPTYCETTTNVLGKENPLEILKEKEFVRLRGGLVEMGTNKPLPCLFEGFRRNESPVHQVEVKPFWICKIKITNAFYESIINEHRRPPQGKEDNMPVTEITYGEAIRFCKKLNKKTKLNFRLPTEPEWTMAAAPNGWEYVHEGEKPNIAYGHVYNDGSKEFIVNVKDSRWPPNYLGLDQMGHNVSEMTYGTYYALGSHGFETDGMYYIARGGNYGHCKFGLRVHTRAIVDVADRNPRIGFRLAHDDI